MDKILKNNSTMKVIKRDGRKEDVSFDKIIARIDGVCKMLNLQRVNAIEVAQETIPGLHDGITTADLDVYAANKCAERIIDDPEFNKLAAGISVSNLHKTTPNDFMEVTKKLYNNKDKNGNINSLITKEYYDTICENIDIINKTIDYQRDYLFDYFAIKTLERSYLIRCKEEQNDELYGKIIERPQHMIMRVALGIHGKDITSAMETYDLISQHYFTHASPTLYNAATNRPQLSSCFLLHMDDSIEGIFDETIVDIAKISKWAGGIGVHLQDIRAKGSLIRGTNGNSDGIIPLIKVLNSLARYVNQGGRRNGAIAIYLEPWHADIYDFCDLRKNSGIEELRARDIFLALWVPDLFMKRVLEGGVWSLMCPNECPGLTDTYGEEFEKLYTKYEAEKKYKRQVRANDLWFHIVTAQIETSMPYMLYKDNANRLSNQKNIGTIKSSNLCVAGDTKILTDNGQYEINTLENQQVNVWNGSEWSPVIIKKTGVNKELVKVKFNNYAEIKCTPEHNFYVISNNDIIIKPAKDLKSGDKLISWNLPQDLEYKNPTEFENAYYRGSICTQVPELLNELPITASLNNRLRWFEGLCDSNGIFHETNKTLVISNNNKSFVLNTRLLLQTLGVEAKIIKEDNKYKLSITYNDIYTLMNLGFSSNRFSLDISDSEKLSKNIINVKTVKKMEEKEDTYCFTEHKRHMGMFNGILTGQCAEIIEYSDRNEVAVCNLASICLPTFIVNKNGHKEIDYEKLAYVAGVCTKNLNKIIDINYYPVPKAKNSNLKHRPIGIGVQGLADVFFILDIPYDSEEARYINRQIFETIYYGALKQSMELAKIHGPYSTFQGSPFSEGKLQFHLWGIDEDKLLMDFDWKGLINDIKTYGTRNSLLTAIMPTATTSQIMGFTESCEPITTNLYTRSTLAGEYVLLNQYLAEKLITMDLWTKEVRQELLYDNGSIQNIECIPDEIKEVYKTAFEMMTKPLVQMAVERGPFIDQSQSMNIFSKEPDFEKLTNSHFYGWKNNLKTGMYYLRSQPAVVPIKFGLDNDVIKKIERQRGLISHSSYSENESDDESNEQSPKYQYRQNIVYDPCPGGACSA